MFSAFDGDAWQGFAAAMQGVRRSNTATNLKSAAQDARRHLQERGLVAKSRGAGALLISYPKAGRTWLRYLIATYLNAAYDLGERVTLETMFRVTPNWDNDPVRGLPAYAFRERKEVPLVACTHRSWRRSFEQTGLPILVKVRDPRDIMVSAYFHHTKHKGRLDADISAFLRREDCGVADLVAHLNGVAAGVAGRRHFVVAYEQLSTDPQSTAAAVFGFIGAALRPDLILSAIEASRFAAMQESELATGIPGHDYDCADPDSCRMRKGVAGGFADTLSTDDIAYIEQRCRDGLTPAARSMLAGTGFDD